LYVVELADGSRLQCSGTAAVLALLRKGGARLVEGPRCAVSRAGASGAGRA